MLAAALGAAPDGRGRGDRASSRLLTDLHVRRDRSNLIVRAFERLLPADRFEFRVATTIPLSGGIGSSAAGVVAGLLAAEHFRR